jgi:oligopeptide transport system permease protein
MRDSGSNDEAMPVVPVLADRRNDSPYRLALRRFRRNRMATAALCILGALAAVCVASFPWTSGARQHVAATGAEVEDLSPSWGHWFGRDALGADLLAKSLYGGVISLGVGLIAAAVSCVIGVAVGLIAGFRGGKLEAFLMRSVDVMYGLPYILIVILLVTALGKHLWVIFIGIGAVSWLTMARVVHGATKSQKNREYVEAARAAGVGTCRILFSHVLPNLLGVIVAYATLTVPQAILQESFLSFLGLGDTTAGTWGILAQEGFERLGPNGERWWMVLFPCLLLTVTLLSLNFVGDGLRDAFDPKLRSRK